MKLEQWEKEFILDSIGEAREKGASLLQSCHAIGLSKRTYQRWNRRRKDLKDKRKGPHRNALALSKEEKQEILAILTEERFVDESPYFIVATLADEGRYLCSESTMYRLLKEYAMNIHRGRAKAPVYLNKNKEPLIASRPNQIWSWDISYLKGPKKRVYYFLYLFMDIFSRKIVGWEIHTNECSIKSSELAERLIKQNKIEEGSLRIHSDNGGPMRSSPMVNILEELQVKQSFSRPRVSNDNAFSEALFKTVKHKPEYPGQGFKNIEEAKKWMEMFSERYNFKHKHGGIGYVTPHQKHKNEDLKIHKQRKETYIEAKSKTPQRFINGIKNFDIKREVELNGYRLRQ